MLYYITSNQEKINVAKKYLSPFNIEVEGKYLDFKEIQSESIEEIAIHKAQQAYNSLHHPVFVNDAAWYIPALNGFPGPFMKYINQWFKEEDFLNLMHGKPDRSILYKEVFCYIDNKNTKTFTGEIKGKILEKPQGIGIPSWTLVSLSLTGKSIARCWEEGIDPAGDYKIWKDFAIWYKQYFP